MLAAGKESSALDRAVTNFDDIDEEDKAGRKTRLFKRNETQGYVDTASLDAASLDKVTATVGDYCRIPGRQRPRHGFGVVHSPGGFCPHSSPTSLGPALFVATSVSRIS